MKYLFEKYKYQLILFFIFLLAEMIVQPMGNYPLNDDWSYGKTVLILLKNGDVYIGSWCAMTLLSHVIWGFLFVKMFGFSFVALRFSTLMSSLIGLAILFNLTESHSKNKLTAFFICLTLMLNPLYFNLSNTFMTDVNFNTWMLVCVFWIYKFFNDDQWKYLFGFFVMSLVLTLTRQFGLVLPFAFLITCLLFRRKQLKLLLYVLIGLVFTYAGLKIYEHYLSAILPPWSAYKFSNKFNFFDPEFFKAFSFLFQLRIMAILLNILVYTSPFFMLSFFSSYQLMPKRKFWINVLIAITLTIPAFFQTTMLNGNVFTNMSLGAVSFYGSTEGHTYYDNFQIFIDVFKIVLAFITIVGLLNGRYFRKQQHPKSGKREFHVFILLFLIFYLLLIFISNSNFDRYNIPMITICLVLFNSMFQSVQTNVAGPIIILAFFFYASVFGTKDYFALNDEKWKAVNDLKTQRHVSIDKINAGFEVSCWNDGTYSWWNNYFNLKNTDYVIQYSPLSGFRSVKTYYFQRYFPYTRDSISVFERVKEN